jgi:hypothetical protein
VVSHAGNKAGGSKSKTGSGSTSKKSTESHNMEASSSDSYQNQASLSAKQRGGGFPLFFLAFFCGGVWYVFFRKDEQPFMPRVQYSRVGQSAGGGGSYQTSIQL